MYNGDSDYLHTTQNEGIPNITGSWSSVYRRAVIKDYVGAYSGNDLGKFQYGSYEASGNIYGGVSFNASNGETKTDGTYKNDVYGKSDHVTTYNSAIQIWRRIS